MYHTPPSVIKKPYLVPSLGLLLFLVSERGLQLRLKGGVVHLEKNKKYHEAQQMVIKSTQKPSKSQ